MIWLSPGPALGESEPQAAGAAGEASGDGEQAEPEPSGFPAAGGPGEGEHLGPGQELAGQGDDLAPQLGPERALQGQVAQPGVLGAADPVLAAGPAPVPQFQARELALLRVGGEAGPGPRAPGTTTGRCSLTSTLPWPSP